MRPFAFGRLGADSLLAPSSQPFTMDSSYSSGQVLYDDLDLLLPSGLTLPANARRLAGYDVDYSRLVLNRMLGLNTTYITQATFGEM